MRFANLEHALAEPDTQLRLFGKPRVAGKRRMAVTLAHDAGIDSARAQARRVLAAIETILWGIVAMSLGLIEVGSGSETKLRVR